MNDQQRAAMPLAEAAQDLLEAIEIAIHAGDWVVDGACDPELAIHRLREALNTRSSSAHSEVEYSEVAQPQCNQHPDAPHGFDRNASHNADRYVCECESWEPPPIGTWIELTPHELTELIREGAAGGGWQGFAQRVTSKFKSKNTPPVVPVAWLELHNGNPNDLAFESFDLEHDLPEWEVVPLYTTTPSVEAMRIETLEKAAQQVETESQDSTRYEFADAIRSMK